ncbi:SRPBCC family protein [Nonomuraea sp. LPB2021202275-12-8]|uniref:SRPBCC family protein n=1 Tax=Nonomuraea sp. LPB2021202275-12-8 TaxID=3120159 RepID=UPI00300CB9E0
MNEHLTIRPDGRTVLHLERRLPHPPDKVWRAITEPEHLKHWFPAEVTITGDRVSFGFGPDGTVTELAPPRVFAYTWGDDELRWQVRPDGDGSVLVLTHTFGDRFGAASFAAGWHTCVAALLALLDGRRPTAPGTAPDTARLHEDYVAILGLTSGETDDGIVRLERQLTRPADAVWQHLDGARAQVGAPPPAPFTVAGVPAGAVGRAEPGKLLEYATASGTVRWELAEGTGHGARLILTHTGDPASLPAWRARVEELAAALLPS